jgi:hypothetical protein
MSKQRGKPNALKHGANAKVVLLWGEKYEDYETLRAAYFREYYPDGPSEEYLVQAMFDLDRRRRRLVRYDEIKLQNRQADIRDRNESARHWANMKRLGPRFEVMTSAEEVEEYLATMSPMYRSTILSQWPLGKEGDPTAWGGKIAKGLSAVKVPALHEEGDAFIAALDPLDQLSIDLDLKRLERIDAQFETIFKRLVQTKTTKQALQRLQPKLITISSPNKPAEENKPDEAKC